MFKSYSPCDGLVSCPWPHGVYLVIYARWYPMAGHWAYLFPGSFPRCYNSGAQKDWNFRTRCSYWISSESAPDFVNYSSMFEWRKTLNLWPFFPRIRIFQSVKGRWKSNRPRSIVLFILGEKRVSGTPPLNTILPGQQCLHHGIWDGDCL